MVFVDEGIVQLIVVIAELDDGIIAAEAFFYADPLRQRTGQPVVDDYLQGDDFYLAAELLTVAGYLYEVGLHSVFIEVVQQDCRYLVVERAFSYEAARLMLL